MSQKVNPHGARVGLIFNWAARWYSSKKDFSRGMVAEYRNRHFIWWKKLNNKMDYKGKIRIFNTHIKLILNSV